MIVDLHGNQVIRAPEDDPLFITRKDFKLLLDFVERLEARISTIEKPKRKWWKL